MREASGDLMTKQETEKVLQYFMQRNKAKQNYQEGGKVYKGTLPLNLNMFPIVESPTKKGKVSNIITRYYESDGKYILVPSMMRGKMLDDSDINKMIRQGKHFGVYDTKKELDKADSTIHDYFKKLGAIKRVGWYLVILLVEK